MLTLRRSAPVAVAALLALLVLMSTTGGTSPASEEPTPPRATSGSGSVGADPLLGDQQRPNIVVIMADDMRDDDIRFMPNVQRPIGDEGVRFTNTFSPHPLCCPARASFLTGQYTHNHKVWSHADPFGFRVFDDDETLPVWLRDVGYNTAFLGKYLNGYGRQTLLDGSPSLLYVPPGWTDWRGSLDGGIEAGSEYDGGTYRFFDTTLNVNGKLEPHQGQYNTRLLGDQSREIIAESARSPKPFFLWASYVAPHHGSPAEPDDPGPIARDGGGITRLSTTARPEEVKGTFDDEILAAPGAAGEADMSDKPYFLRNLPPLNEAEKAGLLELTRQRAEALSVVDEEVERTIEQLEATGELDDTIVAFTSDNGYFLGEHRDRQGKTLPYEPSLRVPLLIRGPGIPRGEVREDPFTMIDFAPTFLAAAGAQSEPSVDGVDLLDVARDGDRGWTRGIFTETGPRTVRRGVKESSNFLVRGEGPSPLRFSQGLRVPRYLYVEHASREKELYDIRRDPGQLTNLVDRRSQQPVVRRLARMLDRLRNCVGAECTLPLPKNLQSVPNR